MIHSIAEAFTDTATFIRCNTQRKCRQECGMCERKWRVTKTKYIHRIALVTGEHYWLCDSCLPEVKEEK